MENQEFINKSTDFVNNKMQELCYLYITERQKNNNELGCLILNFKDEKIDVGFYPISSDYLSKEVKEDIQSKTNNDQSNVIFFIIEEKTNFSFCISKNLV